MSFTADDLTVVVPARDAEPTLARTLRSLVDQDAGRPWIVVVDDGSVDATSAIARRVLGSGAVVLRAAGIGPGAARNLGIEVAATEFLAFCDADDEWTRDRIRLDLIDLEACPDVDVLLGRCRYETNDERLLAGHRFDDIGRSALVPHFGAATMRRSVIDEVGTIDASLWSYEDYEWFSRARDLGAVVAIHDRVAQTRHLRPDSLSHSRPATPTALLRVMQRSVARRRDAGLGPAAGFPRLDEINRRTGSETGSTSVVR